MLYISKFCFSRKSYNSREALNIRQVWFASYFFNRDFIIFINHWLHKKFFFSIILARGYQRFSILIKRHGIVSMKFSLLYGWSYLTLSNKWNRERQMCPFHSFHGEVESNWRTLIETVGFLWLVPTHHSADNCGVLHSPRVVAYSLPIYLAHSHISLDMT